LRLADGVHYLPEQELELGGVDLGCQVPGLFGVEASVVDLVATFHDVEDVLPIVVAHGDVAALGNGRNSDAG
jgi:hypothetical protein